VFGPESSYPTPNNGKNHPQINRGRFSHEHGIQGGKRAQEIIRKKKRNKTRGVRQKGVPSSDIGKRGRAIFRPREAAAKEKKAEPTRGKKNFTRIQRRGCPGEGQMYAFAGKSMLAYRKGKGKRATIFA